MRTKADAGDVACISKARAKAVNHMIHRGHAVACNLQRGERVTARSRHHDIELAVCRRGHRHCTGPINPEASLGADIVDVLQPPVRSLAEHADGIGPLVADESIGLAVVGGGDDAIGALALHRRSLIDVGDIERVTSKRQADQPAIAQSAKAGVAIVDQLHLRQAAEVAP